MINGDFFQKIFNEINKYLPENWAKVVAYFEYGEEAYSFSFYVKENGVYTKCYDIPGIDEDSLMASFEKIYAIISAERENNKSELWTTMTMVIDDNGSMKTDYDYVDLSEGTYQYKKNWKRKYLN